MPAFSVLIVNYNSAGRLESALESLERQSFRDFDVHVLDNAGDDTAMVRDLCRKEFGFPVEFQFSDRNIGFAAGVNRLASLAGGEWLALLNPDARADSGWLDAAWTAQSGAPEGTDLMVSLQLDADDPALLDGAGDRYSVYGLCWRVGHGRRREGFAFPGGTVLPCGAAAFYRREVFLAADGFCERFFCYLEDVDLALRLVAEGSRSAFLPDAVVHHEGGASSGGKASAFAVRYGMRNLPSVFVRNMPPGLLVLCCPVFVTLLALLCLRNAFRGRGGPALAGLLEGLTQVPAAMRERRILKSRRVKSLFRVMVANPVTVMTRG